MSPHPGHVFLSFRGRKTQTVSPPSPSFFPFPEDKENADVDFSTGRLSFFIEPAGNFMRI
jgi:hypothetical protein